MNGQHFNSSGSGNGTPTPPSNSSYPASLSSQSSRDPSPHARELGVPSHYGYTTNYDKKSSPHMLVNNYSNMPVDPAKQPPPLGVYTQKSHQQFMNTGSSTLRTQPQGLMNHNLSPNISTYNSTTDASTHYFSSGNKYNVLSTQNSSHNTSSTLFTSPPNNNPYPVLNRNQFQINNPTTLNAVPKPKPVAPSIDSKANDVLYSQSSQLPSNPSIVSGLSSQSTQQNIPSSSTVLSTVNLTSTFDHTKPGLQPVSVNSDNLSSRFGSGSTDKLNNSLPQTATPPPQLSQFVNVNSSSSSSTSPRSSNNLTSTPDLSPSGHVNSSFSPSSTNSSVHSSQETSSSSSSSITNQPSSLPPPPMQSATSSVQSVTTSFPQSSLASSQNLFLSSASTPPQTSQSFTGRPLDANVPSSSLSSPSNHSLSQNQVADSMRGVSSLNHSEERPHTNEAGGSGDQSGKSNVVQPNPMSYPTSQPSQQQSVAFSQSQQFQSHNRPSSNNQFVPSQTQTFNQNRPPVSSFSNLNQTQSANVVSAHQNISTSHSKDSLGQFSNFQKFATPPSSASNVSSKPPGMPPVSSYGQQMLPPNVASHPPFSPQTQQHPTMPPTSSDLYIQKPPTGLRPSQQVPPTSYNSHPPMPPNSIGQNQPLSPPSLGSHSQMPASSVGSHQQIPPPLSLAKQYSAASVPSDPRKSTQYLPQSQFHQQPPLSQQNQFQQCPPLPQQNQIQQRPPLPNQYPQYPPQNTLVQSQPMSNVGPYGMSRYPPMPNAHGGLTVDSLANQFRGANITQDGFNRLWGMDTFDLLKTRDLLPNERMEAPTIRLNPELFDAANCSPELFRCTLTKIPETKSLLDKSRLPLGVLIHPFKDLTQLSVIQCSTIVRCRACRTYINPFVFFVDNKRWKCNLCFRVNELPDEFQFDPMSKTYGDPSRRPEIKSATIEFIAPSEYMVRPPQPAIYLFLLDVSRLGAESGYLEIICQTLIDELDNLPGDARTSVGFITYDSNVHFYSLAEGLSQPHQMVIVDIDDMFLPCPENLLVNLSECHDLIKDLLMMLPKRYAESYDTESALGAALQAAYKLLLPTGGRITVFQSRLPSIGPGALVAREDPSQRASDTVPHLNPSTDFYKKLALDCSSQQIAVDLFIVNSQYVDVATLSGVSRFSGGCMYHFPLFRMANAMQVTSLKRTFQRYLTRKIGFESVMRLRCTRGLSIHTFHGNFFVRSTDLLSLPNVNPDAGFGMQVSIDETLSELSSVCFQAALLYTSSKGERRIRVHTLCLPIATNLSDILNAADQQCIIGLLAKMAVDRSIESSLTDAREAFINVVADILSAYKLTQNSGPNSSVLAPKSLRLIPMYILALLKSVAFRTGQSTRLDDRVFAMCQMKTLPLSSLLQSIYPDLYPVHNLDQQPQMDSGDENPVIVPPQRLHLSSEKVDSHGVYLLDIGTTILIYVGHNVNPALCQALFGVPHFTALPQDMYEIPELSTLENERLRDFVFLLLSEKPFDPCIQIIRDDGHHRGKFLEHLVEDKNEAGTSYYEFLQRIKVLMK